MYRSSSRTGAGDTGVSTHARPWQLIRTATAAVGRGHPQRIRESTNPQRIRARVPGPLTLGLLRRSRMLLPIWVPFADRCCALLVASPATPRPPQRPRRRPETRKLRNRMLCKDAPRVGRRRQRRRHRQARCARWGPRRGHLDPFSKAFQHF